MRVPDVFFWLALAALIVAALATAIAAFGYRRDAEQNAERIDALKREIRMRDEEALHTVGRRLPVLTGDTRWPGGRSEVPGPLHPELSGTRFADAQESVLAMFGDASGNAEHAAQGLLLAVARKLQGLANGQQLKITEMTERHDDAAFLEDLMHLDHTNAQILRRAVGMAVVCRAWPGRQHQATSLHDVVRGAIGRILDYTRVQIVRIDDSRAVTGRVVEPVVMTLAELLENATRSSHPQTPVHVHVQLTHSGLAFVIEDAGVGLNAAELGRAERLLRDETLGVADLGDPPRFGLAACGALARRYGFSVSVDTASAFGGVRAVVNVPNALLTDSVPVAPPAARAPAPDVPPAVTAVAGTGAGAGGPAAAAQATTANGLPKRSRQRQPASAADATVPPVPAQATAQTTGEGQAPATTPPATPPATPPPRSPGRAAASMGAFQRGGRAAAEQLHPSTEGTPSHDREP